MTRTRGTTVEILDHQLLTDACREHAIAPPSYSTNGLLTQASTGRQVIISSEGVGSTNERVGHVFLDTDATQWECLPTEVVLACRTGETCDLADLIRTFGSRLDVIHSLWREWAAAPEPA